MTDHAHVESIDSLKALRAAVIKFIDAAGQALLQADAQIDRTLDWLRRDRPAHWQGQIRKRSDEVTTARLELNRKRLSPTASGAAPSTVDEEKGLARATHRLEEADAKLLAVKTFERRITRGLTHYRASVSRVKALCNGDLPRAATDLERMIESLEAYLAIEPPRADAGRAPDPPTPGTHGFLGSQDQETPDEPSIQQRDVEPGCEEP
jgi:hypothetical protein